jgi:hypothetical protein
MYFHIFLIVCVQTTVLQGVWGEPRQMPDMPRGNTLQAEAVLGMINSNQNTYVIVFVSIQR